MENFQELQHKLFVDVSSIQTKCILYLRNVLLQTRTKTLLVTDKSVYLRKTYIEPTFGAGFKFVIGYNIYSFFMDANEVAIRAYKPDDINTMITIYLDELDIMDLLDICKAVEQHKYV